MSFALMAGVSGLQAHQRMLDVAGNNLANINTIGYKSSRIVFSELLAQVLKKASQPTATIGGINPQQIGSGVQIAGINPDMAQGNLINTNSPLDLAIEGEGYFVLNDGSQDLYTRAGALAVDAKSNLVDPATGYLVQRTGTVGESDNFQTAGENRIKIPYGVGISANATSEITVAGNLSANATLPDGTQKNVLRSNITYTEGGSNATASTEIVNLKQFSGTFSGNATITFSGWKPNGTALGSSPSTVLTMDVTAATKISDILTHLNTDDGGSADEVQTLTRTSPTTADTFTITIGTETTADIAYDAPLTGANSIKERLEDLDAIDDVTVTGAKMDEPIAGTTVFTFGSAQGDVGDMTFNWGTSGGAGSVEETTTGRATRGVLVGAVATLENGRIVIRDTTAGYSQSDLKMVYADAGDDTTLTMPPYFEVITVGGDEVKSFNIVVYDSQGGSHVLSGAFVRNPDPAKVNLWDLILTSISGDVAGIDISGLSDRRIRDIKFNGADGAFAGLDTGTGDTEQFKVTFGHRPDAQVITVDMGTQGQFNGLTQFARASTAVAKEQDGYATGELASVSISNDGYVIGTFTNGVKKNIAALQIALFKNPSGLESIGSGYFAPSVNSGDAAPTLAMTSGAGAVRGGSLEKSNADVASLFVTMIEAQNGYHANARTIRVANDMLKELTNLIR